MKYLLVLLSILASAQVQKIDYPTQIKSKPIFDVREYGAKCDGVSNDSTAIASAMTAALAVRGVVDLPNGTCVISPDTITVAKDMTLRGKGIDQSVLYVTGTGTNGVKISTAAISGSIYNRASIERLTINASTATVTAALFVEHMMSGNVTAVKTYGGTHGIQYGDYAKYIRMDDVVISEAVNGFYCASDHSAENHFSRVSISGAAMQKGIYILRSTNTDEGAYYMNVVNVGGNTTMPYGLYAKSTANTAGVVDDTPIILMCTQCTFDRNATNAIYLENVQNISVTQSWISTVGTGAAAIRIKDGSIFSFTNNSVISASGGGAAVYMEATKVNAPSGLIVSGNLIDASGGTPTACLLEVQNAASPADVRFAMNRQYNVPSVCAGSEPEVAAALGIYANPVSPVMFNVNPSGEANAKVGLIDVATNTKKFLQVNNGTLEIVNNAVSSVVASVDDTGNIINSGFVKPGGVAFTGMVSATNGSLYYCTDCAVTSAADNTCTNGGTGALAIRLNGAYRCFIAQN